ncbi:chorismate synthase [Desulfitobacterium dichloroeliminans LMG P-21439]|uniref:Chorismate synthase n=1 Tax=Desulfitobacterium dichloroeliminans (strain LMG P-21439 / DCA1) TaxID=871963 RepID=L0F9J8_DESDL|nr:chorismate synthase [Desulfitobacterium dichloroeliminans]AGA69882.1 chorismate synthase [Desulfitobacterium dichloroeliminans LMG P-21439]
MRYLTAGESHGPKLVGILEGVPAGAKIDKELIDQALQERQKGPGRGGRMKIEKDQVVILSGIRGGVTTGAPIALEILNRDWTNWEKVMAWGSDADLESRKVTTPRPGHADLTGHLKYRTEVRNVLERASARETAMRVAVGNVALQILTALGVEIRGQVLGVGKIQLQMEDSPEHWERVDASEWKVGDAQSEEALYAQLKEAQIKGESLGGILQVQVDHLPPGLGSYVQWDRKLDGRLAQAVLSVQAMKGVSFGMGFAAGEHFGSEVHDPIGYDDGRGYYRFSNNAGGIEGGMTNGEPIVLQAVMKPIPTLYSPLQTVNMESKEIMEASVERSDVCAVPAALIVLRHVVGWEILQAVLEKFPSDTWEELHKAWRDYFQYVSEQ